MIMLYPNFRRCIVSRSLIDKGDRIVAAVSGGIDSMVMLDLLCRLSPSMNLSIIAAHVNYKLRGRESNADEALVKKAALRYGIPLETASLKPPKGKNLQDAARRLRYDFFSQLAEKHGASAICLAHHAGDQAETVLLHLLRGSGLTGLRGMAFMSMQAGVRIVRPLLDAARSDIALYAKERRIAFREDRTNAKIKYRRNSVRHRLIPLLREFNPRIEDTLSQTALRLADDDDALDAIAEASLDEALVADPATRGEGVAINIDTYKAFPASIRRRLIRIAFERMAGSTRDLNADQLARIDHIACAQKSAGEYRLPAGLRFTKAGQICTIHR